MKLITESSDLEYSELTIRYEENADILQKIADEYADGRESYEELKILKGNLRKAQRGESGTRFEGTKHALARPLYILSVASIQTPTDRWENHSFRWLEGNISLGEYIGLMQDSGRKMDAIRRVEETDLLDKVNVALRQHHITRVARLLSGEFHGINTYLKGVKAWMVPTFMFHVGVIDTNVHSSMSDILYWNLENTPRFHPDMDENQKGKAMKHSETWNNGKIPPHHKDWLDMRVSKYGIQSDIEEFWDITKHVITDSGCGVPNDVLPQVLFNVGGKMNNSEWDRTIHEPIFEALGRNLEKFQK